MAQTISIGKKNTVKVQAPDGSICEVRQPTARESMALDILNSDESLPLTQKAEALFSFMEKIGLPQSMSEICTMDELLEIVHSLTPKKKPSLPSN